MADTEARAANRERWQGRSEVWRRFSAEGPPKPDGTTLALMEAIGAAPGQRILDMASGTGDPSIPLAERVGESGLVVASDQSSQMIAAARERAAGATARPVFVVAGMEELPFPDRTFDGATCRMGIMFPPDRVAAAKAALRVLKPGARIAYAVWGPLADNAMFAITRDVLLAFSGGEVGQEEPQRHSLGAPGALGAILTAAGFRDVAERALRTDNEMPATRPPWRRAIEGENAAWSNALDATARAELERRMVDAFAPYRSGDAYRLPMHVRLGIGIAPA
jgi:SAM-dependent methyltransferase